MLVERIAAVRLGQWLYLDERKSELLLDLGRLLAVHCDTLSSGSSSLVVRLDILLVPDVLHDLLQLHVQLLRQDLLLFLRHCPVVFLGSHRLLGNVDLVFLREGPESFLPFGLLLLLLALHFVLLHGCLRRLLRDLFLLHFLVAGGHVLLHLVPLRLLLFVVDLHLHLQLAAVLSAGHAWLEDDAVGAGETLPSSVKKLSVHQVLVALPLARVKVWLGGEGRVRLGGGALGLHAWLLVLSSEVEGFLGGGGEGVHGLVSSVLAVSEVLLDRLRIHSLLHLPFIPQLLVVHWLNPRSLLQSQSSLPFLHKSLGVNGHVGTHVEGTVAVE